MVKIEKPDWFRHLEDEFPDRRLKCGYCTINAVPQRASGSVAQAGKYNYATVSLSCASCGQDNVFVRQYALVYDGISPVPELKTVSFSRVLPPPGRPTKNFPNVPAALVEPYSAACRTLGNSNEASATMARRCLQTMLTEQGYQGRDLAKQIEGLLKDADPQKRLPSSITATVDFVRNFGNFGAHPINDQTTLQILAVEPGEAEWCIDIVEALFDHYYEQPAQAKVKIDAANAKLQRGGKPPAKN